ncbi:M3 family oligoendopeptidase [Terrilactibacillus laevilacticus]|uniref:M3 family oligoendopeptidase n=1 Tax=Terrilactibacillus laevilacticus TaxID=1380157 RepID=A0ABW5PUB7_9BACI|nr:M3 family oligoendopeptidase [Terrilactibacillus laevilacticus]
MINETLDQTWNLETIFEGGSHSKAFASFLKQLNEDLNQFQNTLTETHAPNTDGETTLWKDIIHKYEALYKRLIEGYAFLECLTAQNMKDDKASQLFAAIQATAAQFEACSTLLESKYNEFPSDVWKTFISDPDMQSISFYLNESRQKAKERLSADQEKIISSLSIDGYHGWGTLYDTIVSNISIPFDHPVDGKKDLSVGQLANLIDDSNRDIRKAAFAAWEKAWHSQDDFCSASLNHLAGFRLQTYKERGWEKVLKEPLSYNRMSDKTLETMWQVITDNKSHFVKYLDRKAKLLGLEKLAWFDVDAPVATSSKKVTYEESANFIIEHFHKFNPNMAKFAEHAIKNRWIEAEDRNGKRPGGFCTSFPLSEESRIFMTFSGTASNISTLAHELGHAYHQSVMNDLPYLTQHYAMNVAETASTFAEMIVSDAAQAAAKTKEEQISFLDEKLGRSIAFFMNIHARFLFETRFYEERKQGIVGIDRLNELMLTAQKEAYCDALSSYHPAFWQSKLHFYITDVPFYNFPYTFGYLFSTGIYVKALEEGATFADKYDALLRDTGRMTVEELAEKHLKVDLTKPDFWQSAVDYAIKDVNDFLELTKD